jgi:putative transposase
MPSRNVIKSFAPLSYYHVYNRGVEKKDIFADAIDKDFFLSLFDRHLNPDTTQSDTNGAPYCNFSENIELQSYCVMNNHYHLFLWLDSDVSALPALMRSVGTSYSLYFNKKYERVGPLFQSRYKAARIESDSQLQHISRYIHLNPVNPESYKYSSLQYFLNPESCHVPGFLRPAKTLQLFERHDYGEFLQMISES